MSTHTKIPQSVVGVYSASTQCMMKRSRILPSPNMSLWCKDYIELKAIGTQHSNHLGTCCLSFSQVSFQVYQVCLGCPTHRLLPWLVVSCTVKHLLTFGGKLWGMAAHWNHLWALKNTGICVPFRRHANLINLEYAWAWSCFKFSQVILTPKLRNCSY